MKRLLVVYTLVSTPLLTDCMTSNKAEKNNNRQHTRGSKMARIKTNSGLEYEILQEGAGTSHKKGQQVIVHYTGWLDNNGQPGTKFDSSLDRKQPFTFIIGFGMVIKGWDEGVLLMKVGEKRKLTIPPELGYGAQGAGNVIPPNATLIFDVELISVSK